MSDETNHCVQYALVGYQCRIVFRTEGLTDNEVRAKLGMLADQDDKVERFNRCPECEQWTMTGDKLRTNIDCPAVRAAIEQRSAS